MVVEVFDNAIESGTTTFLSAPLQDTDAVAQVGGPASARLQGGQFRAIIFNPVNGDAEIVLVTSGQNTAQWQITRAVDDTTAKNFPQNAVVKHILTADGINNLANSTIDGRGQAAGDMLVYSGTTFARLAKGAIDQIMTVRSDGTVFYNTPPRISAGAWGMSPSASSSTNSLSLQNAINQAAVNSGKGPGGGAPGGGVDVPAGRYSINASALPTYGVSLYGAGGNGGTELMADQAGVFTNGSRSSFKAMMKWNGGDIWCHGVKIVGIYFNTNNVPGLSATWFQSAGEHSWFDDLSCNNTVATNRTVADAQIVNANMTVTFTATTFTEEDVNALVTDRVDGDHTLAGPTIPAYTKIDRVNYVNPGYNAQASDTSKSITLSKAPTGPVANSLFTIKRPTDAFVFDGSGTPGRIGQLQGVTNSGALLRLKGTGGIWRIEQLSGDDNIGGLLRVSRDSSQGGDPTYIYVQSIKAESDTYNANWQAAHDPVVLLDRCSFLSLHIASAQFIGGAYARDAIRIDQWFSGYPQAYGGPSIQLDGVDGWNPWNPQFQAIIHETVNGEQIRTIPGSYVVDRRFGPLILWGRDLLFGGGSRVPDFERWGPHGGTYLVAPFYNNCAANSTVTGMPLCPLSWYNGSALLQDQMTWFEDLDAGTWNLTLTGITRTDGAIVTVELGRAVVLAPAVPTLASVAGAGPSAGTYYSQVTYQTANGETVAGPYTSIAMDGAHAYQVTAPDAINAPQNNPITGWNVYITAAGGGAFYKQNAQPLAIGTNYVLNANPSLAGSAPPLSDTSGIWTTIGTWDQYSTAGGGGTAATKSFTGVVVPVHHGPMRLRFRITGRNVANTTTYSMQIGGRQWQRTA